MSAQIPSSDLPLAVSMGDPAGIGLDIALAAWVDRASLCLPPFVLIADPDAVAARAALLGLAVPLAVPSGPQDAVACFAGALPLVPVALRDRPRPGHPDPANAAGIVAAIERAENAIATCEASAMVTLPIAKSVLTAAGFAHPGHTEFLGALAERRRPGQRYHPVMMLASEALRVVPLTVHIPLAAVPGAVTAARIASAVRIIHAALRDDFAIPRPRIAVAGLNPHAGEAGTMGTEDRDVIAPAVAALAREGFAVTGPHPADTLFHEAARVKYDAVLAMYHDQALIPIKTIAFDSAVNVTLGLPFVRTSPDHGTAFDIAGSGRARPDSLIAALRLAETMARARSLGSRRASIG